MSIDPYDPYDAKLQNNTVMAHDNCIWSLASLTSSLSSEKVLCSASADGAIKVWDANNFACLKTIEHEGMLNWL